MDTIMHPYGDAVIDSHLAGSYALCVFSGDKATRFITVDIDTGGKKVVRQVVDAFVELGIPRDRIYISLSGRKGYHVDIFFEPWIYNEKAKNLYELMIWRTGLDPKKVEFAPSITRAIKLPLGVHAKTGNRCWFVDQETLDPVEDFDYIYRIRPIPYEEICESVKEWNKKHWNELYIEMICGDNDGGNDGVEIMFDDEYYESKRLIMPGTRHDTMVGIAYDLRTYGAAAQQIKKALTGFYYRQDRRMINSSEREVLADIESIAQWAEESVPVRKYRPSPNEGVQRSVVLTLGDVENILQGSTSASRRIALLIYSFCRIFGVSHMSYNFITDTLGCSVATVKNSVNDLLKLHIIRRKSGGLYYKNGRLIRQANTYFIDDGSGRLNAEDHPDAFKFRKAICADTFDDLYYGAMIHFFTPEYLKKHLTKPELRECERRLADGAEGAGNES